MSKRRASVVFDHFYIPNNREEVCRARCKYCPMEMSFNRKATSNLLNHMKRKHASIPLDPISSHANHWTPMPTLSSPPTNKWHNMDTSQILADHALVNLVAGEQLPASIVESPLFLAFMQETQPCYNVPSRAHLVSTLVGQRHSLVQARLEELVRAAVSACLTVDIWAGDRGHAYVAIAGHLVVDYSLKSVTFSCKRVRSASLALTDIPGECEKILARYDMSRDVTVMVGDNAARADASLPGFQPLAEESEPGADARAVEVKLEGGGGTAEAASSSSEEHYGTRFQPSFSHALQLAVRDGLSATARPTADVLAKVCAVAAEACDSNPASATGYPGEAAATRGCARWNGQLKLVRSILGCREEARQGLSASEQAVLEDFLDVLRPFEEIADRIQGERVVPASLVIPSIQGIRQHLGRGQSRHNRELAAALTAATDRWLSVFERQACHRRATALDPRLKLRWCEGEQSTRVREELLALTAASGREAGISEAPAPTKRRSLFPFFEDEPAECAAGTGGGEVETYLREPCLPYHHDPLLYWRSNLHRFPRLAPLALRYLCVPAAPAATLRPAADGLSDAEFERLAFVKLNGGLT